jgi:tight adherence protein C
MTAATLLAATAGGVAALGTTDLAQAWSVARSPVRTPRRLALALLARAGRSLDVRAPRDLAARMELAGVEAPPGDVMAVKAGAALVALLATLPLAADLPGRGGPAGCAVAAAGAFLAPDVWLRRRASARRRAVEAELADVLDLLRVAVAAGLSAGRALAEVGRRHPGTLAAELRRAAHAVALGVPAADALTRLERRCPAAGIAPLIAALRRAARHGAPLGPALEAQAAEARSRSARAHTERAARAAPQVQLVVALLLVPSVLLLVAAALIPA